MRFQSSNSRFQPPPITEDGHLVLGPSKPRSKPQVIVMPTSLKDGWTKAGVKRLARKVIGPQARVWAANGRVYLGIEAPARRLSERERKAGKVTRPPQRLSIAAAGSWAELVDRAFVQALKAYEKAAAEGHVPTLEERRNAAGAELGRLMGGSVTVQGEGPEAEKPTVTPPDGGAGS